MNNDMTRQIGRRNFLSAFGVLTLAACSGGANVIANGSPSGAKGSDIVIDPCPDCAPTIPTLPISLSQLTPAEVAALTATQIRALTGDQIASFTDSQLGYITQATAFHGAQATAVLQRIAASQGGRYPQPPPSESTPPAGYSPPVAGSNFWTWAGGIIGGIIGSTLGGVGGGVVAGPPGAWIGGTLAGTAGSTLGAYNGGGSDAQFIFWNSDTGAWNTIDLGDCCTPTSENGSGQISLDTDGYTVIGTYSAGCSNSDSRRRLVDSSVCDGTVTITVIAN